MTKTAHTRFCLFFDHRFPRLVGLVTRDPTSPFFETKNMAPVRTHAKNPPQGGYFRRVCAHLDSNQGPPRYKLDALTN